MMTAVQGGGKSAPVKWLGLGLGGNRNKEGGGQVTRQARSGLIAAEKEVGMQEKKIGWGRGGGGEGRFQVEVKSSGSGSHGGKGLRLEGAGSAGEGDLGRRGRRRLFGAD